ncbi:MAG TPA: hypothetical protein VJK02_13260 [Anaerolineales bacterium]|nr:hypothetical protein [Anaerolineales bacterium]
MGSEKGQLVVDDLDVRSAPFDPIGDARKDSLGVASVVAHNDHGDDGRPMMVIVPDFGCRYAERAMKLGKERLEAAALLLERRTIRQVEFYD